MLYVSGSDRSVLISARSGNILRSYKTTPSDMPHASTYSSSTNTILATMQQPVIISLSPASQQPLRKDMCPERLTALTLSGCGSFLYGGGESGALYVWHCFSGQMLGLRRGHLRRIEKIAINSSTSGSASGTLVATASADSTVKVYHVASLCSPNENDAASIITQHTLPVTDCAFMRTQPTYLVTVSLDRSCRVTDTMGRQGSNDGGICLFTVFLSVRLRCLSLAPDDKCICIGGEKGTIAFVRLYGEIWDTAETSNSSSSHFQRFVHYQHGGGIDGHQEDIVSMAILPSASSDHVSTAVWKSLQTNLRLATASQDGVVLLWELPSGEPENDPIFFKKTTKIAKPIIIGELFRLNQSQPSSRVIKTNKNSIKDMSVALSSMVLLNGIDTELALVANKPKASEKSDADTKDASIFQKIKRETWYKQQKAVQIQQQRQVALQKFPTALQDGKPTAVIPLPLPTHSFYACAGLIPNLKTQGQKSSPQQNTLVATDALNGICTSVYLHHLTSLDKSLDEGENLSVYCPFMSSITNDPAKNRGDEESALNFQPVSGSVGRKQRRREIRERSKLGLQQMERTQKRQREELLQQMSNGEVNEDDSSQIEGSKITAYRADGSIIEDQDELRAKINKFMHASTKNTASKNIENSNADGQDRDDDIVFIRDTSPASGDDRAAAIISETVFANTFVGFNGQTEEATTSHEEERNKALVERTEHELLEVLKRQNERLRARVDKMLPPLP